MAKETGRDNEVLIATLGENPQVVTLSLDLLRARGHPIDELVSVHTAGKKVREALARLNKALPKPGRLSHRPLLITGETGPVSEFRSEADVTALLQTLYREVKIRKRAGQRLHLIVTGGPKVMSAYTLVVAQLLFGPDDRAWYLLAGVDEPGEIAKGQAGSEDHSQLVSVPVLRWTPMATMTTDLARTDDPWQVIHHQQALQQQEHDIRLRVFLQNLPKAQQAVARLLAEGLDNKAIAKRRGASINTVPKQISAIYTEWRRFFGLPENASVRSQIAIELAGYFARQERE